jgi:hypothetical protein
MSETVRGLVLLVSLVLWLPVLRPLLAGELSTAEAGVRYAGALALAWGGVALLCRVVAAYTAEPEDMKQDARTDASARPAEGNPARRQEDVSS